MQYSVFGREIPCENTAARKVTVKPEFVSKMWGEGVGGGVICFLWKQY